MDRADDDHCRMREAAAARALTNGRSDRQLIDAALAVNAAPTIEAAFDLLAEQARILLAPDSASVVVWDPERRGGTVRARTGTTDVAAALRLGLID